MRPCHSGHCCPDVQSIESNRIDPAVSGLETKSLDPLGLAWRASRGRDRSNGLGRDMQACKHHLTNSHPPPRTNTTGPAFRILPSTTMAAEGGALDRDLVSRACAVLWAVGSSLSPLVSAPPTHTWHAATDDAVPRAGLLAGARTQQVGCPPFLPGPVSSSRHRH